MGRHAPALLACLCLVATTPAAASPPLTAPELERLRAGLAAYDLSGDRTLGLVRALGSLASRAAAAPDRREARFLRAVVGADLAVLAFRSESPTLAAGLARALEVGEPDVMAHLRGELEACRVGAYATVAGDALAALGLVDAIGRGQPIAPGATTGPRQDLVLLAIARAALAREAGAEAALTGLVPDPCSASATCPEPYRGFAGASRPAVAALAALGEALARVARAAEEGDPLLRAATWEEDRAALQGVVLTPLPALDDALAAACAVADDAPAAPLRGALLIVGRDAVRVGFMPTVSLDERGALAVTAAGAPVLPALAPVVDATSDELGRGRSVAALVAALREARVLDPRLEASVAVQADAQAELLATALRSTLDAGLATPTLVGRASDGTARAIALSLAASAARRRPAGQLRVSVLEWGYSLMGSLGSAAIPRASQRHGGAFDRASLESRVRAASFDAAALQFSPSIAAEPVLHAAFEVARGDRPLTVVLP